MFVSACSALIMLDACSGERARSSGEHLQVTGQGPPTSFDPQAETVMSVQTFDGQDPIVDVAFNDETGEVEGGFVEFPPNGRIAHPGYSLMGVALSTNGGGSFTYLANKIRPPFVGMGGGWDALWGDPAITKSRRDQSFVYVSNLAISHESMQEAGGTINGSVANCGFNPNCPQECTSFIDGACIARSHDGGQHFDEIQIFDCLTHDRHFYDGGSMESDLAGGVYAAFNDVTASAEDVWYAPDPGPDTQFQRITPGPFVGRQMISHPRLRYDYQTGRLYIMALAAIDFCNPPTTEDNQVYGELLIDYWDGGAWHGWRGIGSQTLHYPTIHRGLVVGDPADLRRGVQFSFDVGTPSVLGNDDIRWGRTTEEDRPGQPYLEGGFCDRDLTICSNVGTNWTTLSSEGKQFDPVVMAQPFFITVPAEWVVSYNSTEFEPNDNFDTTISAMTTHIVVDSGGSHLPWTPTPLVQSERLCPDTRGYWGDYDDVRVLSIANNVPTFIRTHTDSSDACASRDTFTAMPMHVSAHTFQ